MTDELNGCTCKAHKAPSTKCTCIPECSCYKLLEGFNGT